MCGLFFTKNSLTTRQHALVSCLVARRGDLGVDWFESDSGALFAHSLLPIRGRKPVHQPLIDRNRVAVFAGEIWNLRTKQSDSQFVARLLGESGPRKTFSRLDGNWAIITERRGEVRFATDRYGQQPLHFAIAGQSLGIASEIKSLVAAGYELSKVKHVVPGNDYAFRGGELKITPLFAEQDETPIQRISEPTIRSKMAKAVSIEIKAADMGTRIACLLSGGLDSSIIAYHASQLGITDAYCVATDCDVYDAVAAREVATAFGMKLTLIVCKPPSPDFGIVFGEHATRSIVEEFTMHIPLAQVVRNDGVKVLLTGNGADELFVGYSHLLGKETIADQRDRFVNSYHRFDLRALNKLYGGYAIEVRNPFMNRAVASYTSRIDPELLPGPKKQMKWPLRVAYKRYVPDCANRPKLIARETMGAKAIFASKLGKDPYLYRPRYRELLGSGRRISQSLGRLERYLDRADFAKFTYRST